MFKAGVPYFVYFFNNSSPSFLIAASQLLVFMVQYFALLPALRTQPAPVLALHND